MINLHDQSYTDWCIVPIMVIHHLLMNHLFMMMNHVGGYKKSSSIMINRVMINHQSCYDQSCYDQFQIVSKSSNGMRNWSSYLHRDSKSRNWTKFSREIIVLTKIFELLDKVFLTSGTNHSKSSKIFQIRRSSDPNSGLPDWFELRTLKGFAQNYLFQTRVLRNVRC